MIRPVNMAFLVDEETLGLHPGLWFNWGGKAVGLKLSAEQKLWLNRVLTLGSDYPQASTGVGSVLYHPDTKTLDLVTFGKPKAPAKHEPVTHAVADNSEIHALLADLEIEV